MLIVITPSETTPEEIADYNRLFPLGLQALHLRLPNASRAQYEAAICAIAPEYRHRVVLCDYFDLVLQAGLGGIHLRSDRLGEWRHWQGAMGGRISVSAHTIEELQTLPFVPTYALLSPLYDSLSKEEYKGTLDRDVCSTQLPKLPFPVLALGGITPDRHIEAMSYGFSGSAVLGYLSAAHFTREEAFLRFPPPEVLSVAGHDPTSGAGIVADARTIETEGAFPLTICSVLTEQTEQMFLSSTECEAQRPLTTLLRAHRPLAAKIGLLSSLRQGIEIASTLRANGTRYIVWDPILKATASTEDIHPFLSQQELSELLTQVTLVTPNWNEALLLFGTTDTLELSLMATQHDVAILLKGGHSQNSMAISTDYLILPDGTIHRFAVPRTPNDKHGTGCTLSASIATRLAQGYPLPMACRLGQWRVDALRRSTSSLLGQHNRIAHITKQARLRNSYLQYITDTNDLELLLEKAKAALDGGVRWVQLRMKEATRQERTMAAWALKALMQRYEGTTLIIDDDLETALACDADGVHLGLNDASPVVAREILGGDKIIGGTCNRVEDIALRALEGVDYVGVGPYRQTETKKLLSPLLGERGMEDLVRYNRSLVHPIPLIAIGGIVKEDFDTIARIGLSGVALSGAINHSDNPKKVSAELVHAVYQSFTKKQIKIWL